MAGTLLTCFYGDMRAALFLLALSSCASPEPQPAQCAARKGTYLLQAKTRSGSCPAFPEQVYTWTGDDVRDNAPAADAGCTGDVTVSADLCAVTLARTCGSVEVRGQIAWARDGAEGKGVIQRIQPDCQGTYDVTYRRQ